MFATGILSIPNAMYSLGALGGALSVIGWGALNTCTSEIRLYRMPILFDTEQQTLHMSSETSGTITSTATR